jgi:hypothetical protein
LAGGDGAPEPEFKIIELEFEKLAEGGTPDEQGAHCQSDADNPAGDRRLNESGQALYHGWDLNPSKLWAGMPPRTALRINPDSSLKVWFGGPGPQKSTGIIRGYDGEVNNFRSPVENIAAPGREDSIFSGCMLFPAGLRKGRCVYGSRYSGVTAGHSGPAREGGKESNRFSSY